MLVRATTFLTKQLLIYNFHLQLQHMAHCVILVSVTNQLQIQTHFHTSQILVIPFHFITIYIIITQKVYPVLRNVAAVHFEVL